MGWINARVLDIQVYGRAYTQKSALRHSGLGIDV
jgi:hypothetical protein